MRVDDETVRERVHSDTDVVVVGAGFSGLTAARSLCRNGLSVILCEADDHVGGRVRSATVAGAHVELGGTFVGPGQDRIVALAEEVGVDRFPTYDNGDNLIRWRRRSRRYSGTIPSIGVTGLLDVARLQRAFAKISDSVPAGRPWDTPGSDELDAQTFGSWLRRRRASRSSYELFAIMCRVSWGCEPSEISLLHVAHYVRLCGGLDPMLDTAGGAQEQHFVDGSSEIAARVAAELGDRIRLGQPVTSIEWTENAATVRTAETAVRARRVVVAVPPGARHRIAFSPALPPEHRILAQRWTAGVLSKAYAVYDRPFWRANDLSGQSLSDAGPASITFDASPPDAERGVLLGFIGGVCAQQWDRLPEDERRRRVLTGFADLFGGQALNPIGYVDQRWAAENWVAGGPTAMPGPGSVVPYAPALTAPLGPVHWAGTETADAWSGFMDGAVRAGERAASEIYRDLTG